MASIDRERRMRMDFVFDVVESNDATRIMCVALRPDPRRYEAYEFSGSNLMAHCFAPDCGVSLRIFNACREIIYWRACHLLRHLRDHLGTIMKPKIPVVIVRLAAPTYCTGRRC
jgi:hypothetical protein